MRAPEAEEGGGVSSRCCLPPNVVLAWLWPTEMILPPWTMAEACLCFMSLSITRAHAVSRSQGPGGEGPVSSHLAWASSTSTDAIFWLRHMTRVLRL